MCQVAEQAARAVVEIPTQALLELPIEAVAVAVGMVLPLVAAVPVL
jgi:hypothetical protein